MEQHAGVNLQKFSTEDSEWEQECFLVRLQFVFGVTEGLTEEPSRIRHPLSFSDFLFTYAPVCTEGNGKVSCWLYNDIQLAISFLVFLEQV